MLLSGAKPPLAAEGQTGAEGSDDHGGEAGSVETAGSAAEGESGASSTNVEGKR